MSKVFISVGHGGADPGTIATDGTYEKDIALEIAKFLKIELERHNITVKMSREKDETDKVSDEIAECNSFAPDYGISIHCNSCQGHNASGFEVWHSINANSKGVILAKSINGVIVANGVKSRGLKTKTNSYGKDYLAWIRLTNAPVVLCEVGFIDNEENYNQLKTSEQRKTMASYIAQGILDVLEIEYVPEIVENDEEDKSVLLDHIFRVQVGTFSVKTNAEMLQKRLKEAGFSSIIVESSK